MYNRNRKKLRKYIVRAVGDLLKLGYSDDKIRQQLEGILYIFYHRDDSLKPTIPDIINQIIYFVKDEARYSPHGLTWMYISTNKVKQYASWMKSFNKVTDWAMFCAIDLINEAFKSNSKPSLFAPATLDQIAGIDRHTRESVLNRLAGQGYIINYHKMNGQFDIPQLNYPHDHHVHSDLESVGLTDYALSQESKAWFNIHLLNTGRPANTNSHSVFPHIFINKNNGNLHFRLGTVTVFQLIAAVFDEYQLNPYRKGIRKDGGFYSIHKKAYSSLNKINKKMPYPVLNDINGNKHISQLIEFQDKIALPATDLGIPFNIAKAKSVLFHCKMLLIGYGDYTRAGFNKKPSRDKIKARINILKKFIKHAIKQSDGRLHPLWNIRGTDSNRTVLYDPDVQNLPRDLRFLLTDNKYRVELWDISEQEAFIGITESQSEQGMSLIENDNSIMQYIISQTGLDKKTVKGIYHPYMKGKGLGTFKKEGKYSDKDIDVVINAINVIIPEVYNRKRTVQQYTLDNYGLLPKTRLGREPIQFDFEKNTTRSIAILDQSIGAEMSKGWFIIYNEMAGDRFPVVLDLHDAIGILVPVEEYKDDFERGSIIKKALEYHCKQLGYSVCPGVKKTIINYDGQIKPVRKSIHHFIILLVITIDINLI
ncbi:MAG: hypothetical protein DRI92_06005, partial [Aquificota bacterium]